MSIEKLPVHYSMQNLPTIYDEEALTALELAARTTGKVNEVVEGQNSLQIQTEKHMDEVDQHLTQQDTAIQEMNDVTMPAKVTAEFEKNLNNGTFSDMVKSYVSNLENRVDNLLGSLEEGSTTGDAELLDIRTGADDVNYPSAGAAIRNQLDGKANSVGHYVEMPLEIITGELYKITTKESVVVGSGAYALYTLTGESKVMVHGCSWSSYNLYPVCAFYDESGNCIATHDGGGEGTYTLELVVPPGAITLAINGHATKALPMVKNFVAGNLQEILATMENEKIPEGDVTIGIALTSDNTEMVDYYYADNQAKLTNEYYCSIVYPVFNFKSILLSEYPVGVFGGAFLDRNKNYISGFSTENPAHLEPKTVPAGAGYISITVAKKSPYHTIYATAAGYSLYGLVLPKTSMNTLEGKKIVVVGTSVSYGANSDISYVDIIRNNLKANVVNCAKPGLAIHTNEDGTPGTYGSLTLSHAEYAAHDQTPENYRTYEDIFIEENADTDLFIFEVAPNNSNYDVTDWELFDKYNWGYTDGSTFADHRKTFLGALLFLMDKMWAMNPKAKMVLLLTSSFSYDKGKDNFNRLRETWNIPVIDLWGKINIAPPFRSLLKSLDGMDEHPSTFAHEIMGDMLTHELLLI